MSSVTLTIPPVRFDDSAGYLFESITGDGICFVPEDLVSQEAMDELSIDNVAYLIRGWARRNGVFNPLAAGHRLFPNAKGLLHDLSAPAVVEFLQRLPAGLGVRENDEQANRPRPLPVVSLDPPS